ncbi:hypothetical protein AVEN_190807-1 [Araneus ventricosus]|uniref:Uncharacterized protein n=1 Tax=Araneus ventricosus TaxID=182803 RepID=A0A4Y2E2P1_ARAVE|nr:hypothetical protein AVEN_190807-1 [Araneus ventricosus]
MGVQDNLKAELPLPALESGSMKNDRCDRSDTEVGVLTAITDHVLVPPEGGTFRHRWTTITIPTMETKTHLLIRCLLIHVLKIRKSRDSLINTRPG